MPPDISGGYPINDSGSSDSVDEAKAEDPKSAITSFESPLNWSKKPKMLSGFRSPWYPVVFLSLVRPGEFAAEGLCTVLRASANPASWVSSHKTSSEVNWRTSFSCSVVLRSQ